MNGLFPIGEFELNEKDLAFQKSLNEIIGSFIRTGRPSKDWPQVTWNNIPHVHLSEKPHVVNETPFKESFDFWAHLSEQLSHDVVQGLPRIKQPKIEL